MGSTAAQTSGRAGLVTHFIAGYPTLEASAEIALALAASGAGALEMQIPFSDPGADGPVIEGACRKALDNGFKVKSAWEIINRIKSETDIPVFVMSYASPVVVTGVKEFSSRAAEAGASGLIIPDLVPGNDEGLFETAEKQGVPAVPVVVPWISDARLREILSVPCEWMYVALRSGITGTYTELGKSQEDFLKKLKGSGKKVMAGFGIRSREQVAAVTKFADAAVVGSALVAEIEKGFADSGVKGACSAAGDLVKSLIQG